MAHAGAWGQGCEEEGTSPFRKGPNIIVTFTHLFGGSEIPKTIEHLLQKEAGTAVTIVRR